MCCHSNDLQFFKQKLSCCQSQGQQDSPSPSQLHCHKCQSRDNRCCQDNHCRNYSKLKFLRDLYTFKWVTVCVCVCQEVMLQAAVLLTAAILAITVMRSCTKCVLHTYTPRCYELVNERAKLIDKLRCNKCCMDKRTTKKKTASKLCATIVTSRKCCWQLPRCQAPGWNTHNCCCFFFFFSWLWSFCCGCICNCHVVVHHIT